MINTSGFFVAIYRAVGLFMRVSLPPYVDKSLVLLTRMYLDTLHTINASAPHDVLAIPPAGSMARRSPRLCFVLPRSRGHLAGIQQHYYLIRGGKIS